MAWSVKKKAQGQLYLYLYLLMSDEAHLEPTTYVNKYKVILCNTANVYNVSVSQCESYTYRRIFLLLMAQLQGLVVTT